MPTRRLILASASPARLALLRAAGFAPSVEVSGVDEDGVPDGCPPRDVARMLAEHKATAVADRLGSHGNRADIDDGTIVVGCDSLLAFAGHTRGKPASTAEARMWWHEHRGAEGVLITGHALVDVATARRVSATSETTIRFGTPTDAEIDAYIATGEPLRVAGAFTLDGYAAPFIDGIDGDHGTVLGLSLPLLRRLLADLGVAVTDLWDRAA